MNDSLGQGMRSHLDADTSELLMEGGALQRRTVASLLACIDDSDGADRFV